MCRNRNAKLPYVSADGTRSVPATLGLQARGPAIGSTFALAYSTRTSQDVTDLHPLIGVTQSMEARLIRAAVLAACILSLGAGSHRTQNFIVTSSSEALSRQIGDAAERYRRELALEWLGHELPPWQGPCPITVHAGSRLLAGGQTSFMFDSGRPFGWSMTIQGSRERILDSVLPHEVSHTVFATHFGRPLPRWADEGACTTVESESEKQKQQHMLIEFLTTERGIAFNQMFAMKQYPSDILPLYAQGYSLARYLIAQGGKQKFIQYVGDGMASNNWPGATRTHYGFDDLSDLQLTWLDWVRQGSPAISPRATLLAQQQTRPDLGTERLVPVQSASATTESAVNRLASRSAPAAATSQQEGSGWYARVRDETRAGRNAAQFSDRGAVDKTKPGQPAAARRHSSGSRQPPASRPRQVILEWKREPAPAPAYPLEQQKTRGKARGKTYLVEPDELRRTILR